MVSTSDFSVFIERWSRAEASERANAQQFLIELADLLEVPRPSNTHADGYTFEYPVKIPLGDGSFTDGRLDLYRRGSFVLEAKQYADAGSKDGSKSESSRVMEQAGVYLPAKKGGPIQFIESSGKSGDFPRLINKGGHLQSKVSFK